MTKYTFNKNREDILRILPKDSIGAEIGVFKGEFSEKILNIVKPKKLHLIDTWWKGEENWDWATEDKSTLNAYNKILLQFKEYIKEGRVIPCVGDDLKTLSSYSDSYFDWVYLDTTHTYEQTSKELKLLIKKVKDKGLITGHDYNHPGVSKAVNEIVIEKLYKLIYLDNHSQWIIKRKSYLDLIISKFSYSSFNFLPQYLNEVKYRYKKLDYEPIFGDGWYAFEDKIRWSSSKSIIQFPDKGCKRVNFKIEGMPECIKKEEQIVSIKVNSIPYSNIILNKEVEVKINKDNIKRIEMSSNISFIPRLLGINDDQRELSFIIKDFKLY